MSRRIPIEDDRFHDRCGLFGIFGHSEAANLAYLGLYALQHRGQESAGIVASDGERLRVEKGMGLVHDVFDERRLQALPGPSAIGHVRYSTAGDTVPENAQPYLIDCHRGQVAVGHNGNLVNAVMLRKQLEAAGAIFQSGADTEVLLHLYARSHRETLEDALAASLTKVMGAFSLLFLTRDSLVAARDPWGFRPLVLGRLGESTIVASETCALDLIDAKYVREIEPGELLVIDRDGMRSFHPFPPEPLAQCVFEHVYFARPDSTIFGRNVLQSRLRLGRRLAREAPAPADIVVPVPDSGMGAALGYAEESGLPFQWGLIRNHYVGRTFIEPKQRVRSFGVRVKLNPVPSVLAGKRVVLIDDSIVRGTTSRKIVRMVREAGALEVHLRISSPPTVSPCYYGIDTPSKGELIAFSHSVEETRAHVEADSLAYLSHEGLLESVDDVAGGRHCSACFTGRYPVAITQTDESQLSLGFAGKQDSAARDLPLPLMLAVGHITWDVVDGKDVLGGSVSYAALCARKLGWDAAVLTSAGGDFVPERDLPGIAAEAQPARHSTRFVNRYDKGGARQQYLLSRADTIDVGSVPDDWRAPDVLLLGSVAGEIPPRAPRAFEAGVVGALAQGWLRHFAADGAVSPQPWADPAADLLGVHVLFLSVHDVGGDVAKAAAMLEYVPIVALTRGWQGVDIMTRDGVHPVPTLPRSEVDPTGAGDVFSAGFLVRYQETGDPLEAAAFGCCAASCVVEGVGTTTLGDRAEVERRLILRDKYIEDGEIDD